MMRVAMAQKVIPRFMKTLSSFASLLGKRMSLQLSLYFISTRLFAFPPAVFRSTLLIFHFLLVAQAFSRSKLSRHQTPTETGLPTLEFVCEECRDQTRPLAPSGQYPTLSCKRR